ncbi:MAG: flagellar biosynthesis repressor FlbT [Hyphomonas sp. BRH_c22]|uniref:flagellar biosynthesis repressor FlbT n=1 Tax=Hyphomonas sp. BRH_c22 TaxID=1629710 RepID=UPI0005F1D3CE|nr:flagellar biosynthesis repressor FlbT [Hyphomonas sp. BRH_c22]KJS34529.1 MAG: flagellar biosynthesis repressor FlbT [Hyphomonas sp. BRH_c22]
MSGLVLKIAPGERFIVNGAILENGDKPARIRITDSDVRVLRCRDALRPEEVNTPCKQVYYAVQLLITGDLEEFGTLPAIDDECAKLLDVFKAIDPELIPTLRSMISRGNYYSALCHLRQILILENQLLARFNKSPVTLEDAKVA